MTTEIKQVIRTGDYICSDFFSPVQGKVKGIGTMGKNIPAYRIETPNGQTEYIIKGQAILLWTKEELASHIRPVDYRTRHD